MIDFRGRDTANLNTYFTACNPETIDTVERAEYYDRLAARELDNLAEHEEEIKQYRVQLFERMKKLYAAPYTLRLTLKRERRGFDKPKVYYYLMLEKVFTDADITPEVVSSTKYTGTERAKALADFRAEIKRRPGIYAVLDIEKGRLER